MQKIKTFIEKNETKLALLAAGTVATTVVVFVKKDAFARYPFSTQRFSYSQVKNAFELFCQANNMNFEEGMKNLEEFMKTNNQRRQQP